ncbi:hypothetical protein EV681_2666 [Advenella incenata]|uniref:Uncharacterized protein n=1 Tax=Advenella incenata TaxID=267800 RepID=A0A4Q7VFG7_9BURK|nr:hypothetical protein EV681_2666 [Advenella incenata]
MLTQCMNFVQPPTEVNCKFNIAPVISEFFKSDTFLNSVRYNYLYFILN